jgi:polysaccharide biosynthesis protein PslA
MACKLAFQLALRGRRGQGRRRRDEEDGKTRRSSSAEASGGRRQGPLQVALCDQRRLQNDRVQARSSADPHRMGRGRFHSLKFGHLVAQKTALRIGKAGAPAVRSYKGPGGLMSISDMSIGDVQPAFPALFSQADQRHAGEPDYFELAMHLSAVSDEPGRAATIALCETHLRNALLRRRRTLAMKRAIDICGSAFGLAVLFLPLLLVALAIKVVTRGPAIFMQLRHGKDHRPITVFKFTTMHPDAWDRLGMNQTAADDPRVTPLGRFLRKTSIDELPQLWNVLRGEMSLVGPRAHPIGLLGGGVPYEELCPHYRLRHLVKPGMTGFAQVSGFRGETTDPHTARMRLAFDLTYVGTLSLAQDVKLLARTFFDELPRMSGY